MHATNKKIRSLNRNMTDKKEQSQKAEIKKDISDSENPGTEEADNPENVSTDEATDVATDEATDVEQNAEELYSRLLRVSAEFENCKKRFTREMDEFRKFANESFARDLLPVLDNLERAVSLASDDTNNENGIVEGVKKTLKELQKVLKTFRVEKIKSLNKPFDPRFHQAIMQEEAEGREKNTVIKELQAGYMIHDRLLRPAMVIVSKAVEDSEEKITAN